MTWRYILQSVPDGEFIDLDAPLSGVSVTKAISGPGSITASIPLEYATLKKSNGMPSIQEWGTMIHVEEDGVILQSAIIDQIDVDGHTLTLSAGGFSMIANEQPWEGPDKNYIHADALDVFRDIYAQLQSDPQGDLGITVDDLSSAARVGLRETDAYRDAKTKEAKAKAHYEFEQKQSALHAKTLFDAKQAVFTTAKVSPIGQIYIATTAPTGTKKAVGNLWVESDQANKPWKYVKAGDKWVAITLTAGEMTTLAAKIGTYITVTSVVAAHKLILAKAKEAYDKAVTHRKDISDQAAQPLTLAWWQTDNLQQIINDLTENSNFEYAERSYWSDDVIKYHIDLGYPSLGGRKNDLRFEIGVNVTAIPRIALDDYASSIMLYGAGEGSKRVVGVVSTPTGRLKRVSVQTNQALTNKVRAESTARNLLKDMSGERSIDSLTVIDHSLAPLGTFQPGDQIRVTGSAGWANDLDLWVRILELTSTPDDNTITLKVVTV